MIAAIMQPTYLPWSGYFDLIDQSDVFVFLDTVQFEKQSWQQRNRIKTPSGPLLLTVPCLQSLPQRIIEVRIDRKINWRRKHWLSISANYSKAPYWKDYREPLEGIFAQEWDRLVDLNIGLITWLADRIGIDALFVRTSELLAPERTRTSCLVDICDQLDVDAYLSPRGAFAYLQSDQPFADLGIRLGFQQYDPPSYPQRFGEFVPYLSVLDLLLNAGPAALEVLRSGRRRWLSASELGGQDSATFAPLEMAPLHDA
jgi:hypothetical protein